MLFYLGVHEIEGGSGRFWGYAMCTMFSTGAFYVFLAGTPLVAKTVLVLSPASLGFYMGTITAGFSFGQFVSRIGIPSR